ncbi:peptidoglycan-binding protein [Alkalicoccus chagannorensis]|uniref:C40 family peptidase n=1 Tax=Alkalicoccus chagannorensis TaxID=427072 RepID=UPI00040F931F|nr:peptidoglycan-binding protein [Alkalicoccus chagannorensis]
MTTAPAHVRTAITTTITAGSVIFAAPTVIEASFGDQTLRSGMQNSSVSALQEELKERGHYDYRVTGVFGPLTEQAVRSFQQSENLQVDGIAGQQTFGALRTESAPSTRTGEASADREAIAERTLQTISTGQVLRPGTSGTSVTRLQTALHKLGFYDHEHATGSYNQATQRAVRNYQNARGLTVDGLAGPQTLGRLNQDINGSNTAGSVSSGSGTSTNDSASSGVIRPWNSGSHVEDLQRRLRELGYYDGGISGQYGPKSQAAVRAFQQSAGITVDGLAGPQTRRAMESASPNNEVASEDESTSGSNGNASSGSGGGSSSSAQLTDVLRSGASGSQVRLLQEKLQELNYYSGSVNGSFTSATETAVRNLQRQAGISVDGVAGPQTYRALASADPYDDSRSGSDSASSGNSNSSVLLQHGVRSDDVKELQERLRAGGFFSGNATGFFGDVTKRAVQDFQRKWNLVSDGLVNQATWEQLEEVSDIHQGEAVPDNTSSGSFNVMNLIADASEHVGVPYLWGGTTPSGFDCSGFIQYVFKQNGVSVPRTVAEQHRVTTSVSTPRAGDIVYFETYRAGPSHNGIYIGNGQFIHAGSSTGITVASMDSSYWSQRYLGAGRVN